jgi:sialidase-1
MLPALAVSAPFLEKIHVFEAGTGGYAHYRIPAIVATARGTLLAFCEARKGTQGDWGTIDLMLRRSTDGGKTWDAPRIVGRIDGPIAKNPVALAQGLAKPDEITYNNPAPIVDSSGAVHLLFCVEYARAFWMRSDDDGITFTRPVEVTATFEKFRPDYAWKVLATGPGHAIQLKSGRLIVPVWLSTGTGGHAHRPSAVSVIYSDDHGRTWHRGDIAARDGEVENPSETLALQLADGRVLLNMRNESPRHRRAISYSRDGATGWTPPRFHEQLIEPVCMASLVRLSPDRILFANPHSTEPQNPAQPDGNHKRQNLTVKLSYDEGLTWPVSRSLEPGPSGYSDLATGPDGAIYCFYENGAVPGGGHHVRFLTLARFNAEWLTGSAGPR